jgi:hypothetical protein
MQTTRQAAAPAAVGVEQVHFQPLAVLVYPVKALLGAITLQ